MKRKNNTRKMVSIALLMALIVALQMLGGVLPSVGGFSISLVLIPVVLGAAVYGPGTGALLGATFGAIVFINCVTGLDGGGAMVFQANAILCFIVVMVKGTLAGLGAGWVYKLIRKKNTYVAMLLAAIVCPVINTGIFVTSMLLFFTGVLENWQTANGANTVLGYVMTGLILANFVPELIINIVFSPASERIRRAVAGKNA